MIQNRVANSSSAGSRLRAHAWPLLFTVLAALPAPVCAADASAAAPPGVFESGDFALYVPANVSSVRGIILALGGPDTRAFLTDGSFGAPLPELEAALHLLGRELRTLAADHGLALLGTSRQGKAELPDQVPTDRLILDAIGEAASISGHAELAGAPIFVYGISGGTPQAIGFTARNPGRVGGLLLKVPAPPKRLDRAEALGVPTLMILAEHETLIDNQAVMAVFEANRRAGGLWAVAIEPGVPHHSLRPGHHALTVNWLRAIVERRLGAEGQDPLREIPESSGWLGHPDIGVGFWENYPGDRRSASWFPSRATAEEWWEFIGRGDPQ